VYQRDDERVLKAFGSGEFDYVDAIGEVEEADFSLNRGTQDLEQTGGQLSHATGTPRCVLVGVCGQRSVHAFSWGASLSCLSPAGALRGPHRGLRSGHGSQATHPNTGHISLRCAGFSEKNQYDRQTPCDQDYLRKRGYRCRVTADLVQSRWAFSSSITPSMRKAFSLGNAPYLFIPDNRSYERSSRLLFDEHNHPLDSTRLSAEEQTKYRWRRCYKMEFAAYPAYQPWG
jgi:hypothetical protein